MQKLPDLNVKLDAMNLTENVIRVLDDALGLNGRSQNFVPDTALMGALPELDSMAAVGLITGLEDHFGIVFQDEDLSGEAFTTVGTLCDLVKKALEQQNG